MNEDIYKQFNDGFLKALNDAFEELRKAVEKFKMYFDEYFGYKTEFFEIYDKEELTGVSEIRYFFSRQKLKPYQKPYLKKYKQYFRQYR